MNESENFQDVWNCTALNSTNLNITTVSKEVFYKTLNNINESLHAMYFKLDSFTNKIDLMCFALAENSDHLNLICKGSETFDISYSVNHHLCE